MKIPRLLCAAGIAMGFAAVAATVDLASRQQSGDAVRVDDDERPDAGVAERAHHRQRPAPLERPEPVKILPLQPDLAAAGDRPMPPIP